MKRTKFKKYIQDNGIKQVDIGFEIKIDHGKLNKIINGYLKPTEEQKKAILDYLNVKESVLFD